MPKLILLLIMALTALNVDASSQMHRDTFSGSTFLIPGFYAGYVFGDEGGFIAGFEVSITHFFDDQSYYGIELNYSGWHHATKLHLGAEIGYTLIGASFGPTLFNTDSISTMGCSISYFAVLGVIPYLSTHIPFDGKTFTEIGGYIKFPYQLTHKDLFP